VSRRKVTRYDRPRHWGESNGRRDATLLSPQQSVILAAATRLQQRGVVRPSWRAIAREAGNGPSGAPLSRASVATQWRRAQKKFARAARVESRTEPALNYSINNVRAQIASTERQLSQLARRLVSLQEVYGQLIARQKQQIGAVPPCR